MIKQLVQLVMPKQLGIVGTALAVGSTALKLIGSRKREDEINEAQQRKEASDRIVRREQAGRIRRSQVKQGQQAIAQAEASKVAGGGGPSSGASNAVAQVQGNVATNLGNLNTDLATGDLNASLNANIQNAGRKGDFEIFNDIINPGLQLGLSNEISKAFTK